GRIVFVPLVAWFNGRDSRPSGLRGRQRTGDRDHDIAGTTAQRAANGQPRLGHRRADVPIRIYALAKDLKIDSKELVEFCNKAGIPGKGSALASLEDDEVSKLKTWMDASSTKQKPSGPAPLVDTKTVLSSPVLGTATLPPPP